MIAFIKRLFVSKEPKPVAKFRLVKRRESALTDWFYFTEEFHPNHKLWLYVSDSGSDDLNIAKAHFQTLCLNTEPNDVRIVLEECC